MAIEDLVDEYWRDALISNATGPQAQAKWNAFVYELQARVAHFPQAAQDEMFLRAAHRNAECIAIARVNLDALRGKLGIPAANNRLADIAAETLVRATVWQSVAAFFRFSVTINVVGTQRPEWIGMMPEGLGPDAADSA
jgi:hypothetical protein